MTVAQESKIVETFPGERKSLVEYRFVLRQRYEALPNGLLRWNPSLDTQSVK